jgi:hypothetical protein
MGTTDRVQVDVAGDVVEISSDECDELVARLKKAGLSSIAGELSKAINQPVALSPDELEPVEAVLSSWSNQAELPDGIVQLGVALIRADPGGHIGIPRFEE